MSPSWHIKSNRVPVTATSAPQQQQRIDESQCIGIARDELEGHNPSASRKMRLLASIVTKGELTPVAIRSAFVGLG